MKRWSRPARIALLTLMTVAFLFAFVFPTRALLAQREDERRARDRLELLREESDKLADEAEQLRSDEEIERLARERYHLVYPGEESYAVVPEGSTTTTGPPPPTGAL